jgi:plastocyanin
MKRTGVALTFTILAMLLVHPSVSRYTAAALQAPAGTARIVAKVVLNGQPPAPLKLQTNADPYCAKAHQTQPLFSQSVEVGADGALVDSLVFVKDGISGSYAAPKTAVTLDQKGCVYMPHVFGLMAGQPLQILNSDATLHNIHPLPVVNTGFNIGMPIQGMKQMKVFSKPEPVFHIKCDVHSWMSAYVAVFTHPFFGVSNDHGVVELNNLPAGTFQVQAWHETYGVQTQSVSVAAGETKEITFSYKAKGA